MRTLEKIARLRAAMKVDTALDEAMAWWESCLSIESDLDFDPRTTPHERDALRRLKDRVSQAIRAIREAEGPPDLHLASIALSTLEDSIERRTIGPDGWPLQK